MSGYGGESGTSGVTASGGGGTPSLDRRRFLKKKPLGTPFALAKTGESGGYQLLNVTQRIDSTDKALFSADEDKGASVLPAARSVQFNNLGDSALGVSLKLDHWEDGTTEDSENHKYIHFIVGKGESLDMPITRMISSDNSAIDVGTAVANTAPAAAMYADSGVNLGAKLEDDATQITTGANGTNAFRIGDLIQVGINTTTITRIEILKVTGISSTTVMTVDRA